MEVNYLLVSFSLVNVDVPKSDVRSKNKNKVVNFMKKIWNIRIALAIACANWIVVSIILTIFFTNPKGLPSHLVGSVLGNYLFYSFVPALISMAITIKVKEGYRSVNLAINILFLCLYTIAFLFSRHMMMNG